MIHSQRLRFRKSDEANVDTAGDLSDKDWAQRASHDAN
jgi:hypothetical protein